MWLGLDDDIVGAQKVSKHYIYIYVFFTNNVDFCNIIYIYRILIYNIYICIYNMYIYIDY